MLGRDQTASAGDVARKQSLPPHLVGAAEVVQPIDQLPRTGKAVGRQRQIVPLRDHEPGRRGHNQSGRDRLLHRPIEPWHIDIGSLIRVPHPRQRHQEAVRIEGVRGTLTAFAAEPRQLRIGEMKAIHGQ